MMRAASLVLAAAVSIQNAEHYRWGDCCDGWYLVKNDAMNIIQERMPPGTAETLHKHGKAQQFFFVISGEATIDIEGKPTTLTTGQGVLVAPGLAHRVQNRSKEDLNLLVTSQPPSHGDRVDI